MANNNFSDQFQTPKDPIEIKESSFRNQFEMKARLKDLEVIKEFYRKMIVDYCKIEKQLKNEIDRVTYLSETDQLTETYNRGKSFSLLEQETGRATRYRTDLSIIILDIDHFKEVNDNYGHNTGDFVLSSLAKLIKKNIRQSDFIARWGGEEFILGLPETDLSGSISQGNKIRKLIENYRFDKVKNITISLGAAQYKMNESIQTLIGRTDKALYKAKAAGRNCLRSEKDPE